MTFWSVIFVVVFDFACLQDQVGFKFVQSLLEPDGIGVRI